MGSQGRSKRLVSSEGETVLPLGLSVERLKRARALGADLHDLGFDIDLIDQLRAVSGSDFAMYIQPGLKKL